MSIEAIYLNRDGDRCMINCHKLRRNRKGIRKAEDSWYFRIRVVIILWQSENNKRPRYLFVQTRWILCVTMESGAHAWGHTWGQGCGPSRGLVVTHFVVCSNRLGYGTIVCGLQQGRQTENYITTLSGFEGLQQTNYQNTLVYVSLFAVKRSFIYVYFLLHKSMGMTFHVMNSGNQL